MVTRTDILLPTLAELMVEQVGRASHTAVTRIGIVEAVPGVRVVDAHGTPLTQRFASFDHFG